MKILYCKKHEKYVSKYHCEFFNEGADCPFYHGGSWNSRRELLADVNRPKWDVGEVSKPLRCSMLNRASLHRRRGSKRRTTSRSVPTS